MSFQEELRISSVYSVGGGNAFAVPPSKSASPAFVNSAGIYRVAIE